MRTFILTRKDGCAILQAMKTNHIVPTYIRWLRQSYEMSQPEFAKFIGNKRDNLAKWETGVANPRAEMFLQILALDPKCADTVAHVKSACKRIREEK